jgi:hypothetical protein
VRRSLLVRVPRWRILHHSPGRTRPGQYIQKNRRVSLYIDDTTIYNNRVQVKGEATVLEEPNLGGRSVEIATRMSVRYLGEHGPQYVEPTLTEPRWLLFVKPLEIKNGGCGLGNKVQTFQMVGGRN